MTSTPSTIDNSGIKGYKYDWTDDQERRVKGLLCHNIVVLIHEMHEYDLMK